MKRPNFFIIGAPKCGTTSLAYWLGQHPKIFMSPLKEPHYYNSDMTSYNLDVGSAGFESKDEYHALFREAQNDQVAVGEATVFYLYSRVAVERILNDNPDARLIVCLRNPVDMSLSLHNHNLITFQENIERFDEAWLAQDERRAGRRIPRTCIDTAFLLYGPVCRLGSQLQRLYRIAPREQVKLVFLDDVRTDTRRTYLEILSFLGVPDDGRMEFSARGRGSVFRSRAFARALYQIGRFKSRLGVPRLNLGAMQRLADLNRREIRPARCDPAFIDEYLRPYFAHEIMLVERIAGRRLEHWKGATAAAVEEPSGEEPSGLRL